MEERFLVQGYPESMANRAEGKVRFGLKASGNAYAIPMVAAMMVPLLLRAHKVGLVGGNDDVIVKNEVHMVDGVVCRRSRGGCEVGLIDEVTVANEVPRQAKMQRLSHEQPPCVD